MCYKHFPSFAGGISFSKHVIFLRNFSLPVNNLIIVGILYKISEWASTR